MAVYPPRGTLDYYDGLKAYIDAHTDSGKQPLDADLTAIAGLTHSDGDVIQDVGGSWVKRTAAQLKTSLGLTKSDVGLSSVDDVQQQPLDADLTAIAGLSPADNDIIQRKSSAWTNRTPAQFKSDLALSANDIGMGNINNTSDANKPVSIQQQSALDLKVDKALYDANTILIATADNTPIAMTVAASRFVGRKASGDIDDMTAAESWAVLAAGAGHPEVIMVAVSDETTAITTGTAKVTFRMPFAFTLTSVRASLTTASTSGIPAVDINEGGASIFSTTLTIDANEKTSTTAATPAVISDANLADDAEMTVDIDTAGTGAKGLKIYLIGTRA